MMAVIFAAATYVVYRNSIFSEHCNTLVVIGYYGQLLRQAGVPGVG